MIRTPPRGLPLALLVIVGLVVSACGRDSPHAPGSAQSSSLDVPKWAKVAPEQIAEAKKHGVPVAFENDIGMHFVLIPAGTFLMGLPEGEADPTELLHEVTLTRPFYLSTCEVTQAVWQAVMDENPSEMQGPSLPVTNVSWVDCQKFLERLNQGDPDAGYRLPTEAEWEHACRAGTKTRYWSGDAEEDLARVGWYMANSGTQRPLFVDGYDDPDYWEKIEQCGCRVHAVGDKPANPWGLYDVHGNVLEWCQDAFDSYSARAPTDPLVVGSTDNIFRMYRGGSWEKNAKEAQSAARWTSDMRYTDPDLGFRVARSVKRR